MNTVLFKRPQPNPRTLFANGEQGLWLDPSDMNATKAAWRRNLLTYSEQFDNAAWTKSGTTVTQNNTTAPDGTTTADLLIETATSARHWIGLDPNATARNGLFTFSIYVKKKDRRYCFITINNSAGAYRYSPLFDLDTGTVVATNTTGTPTNVSNSITSVGNGWYRITASGDAAAGGWTESFFGLSDSATPSLLVSSPTYAGDGTSGNWIWGAQLELGSTPTEYQPITDFSTEFKAAFPTHALYQDSNGVTPCTAAGDPVGLILDQSRGGLGNLGPELWTNPTPSIENATGTVGVYDSGTRTMSNSGSATAGYPRFRFNLGLTTGKFYKVEGSLSGSLNQIASNLIRLATFGFSNSASYNSSTGYFQGIVQAASSVIEFATELDGSETLTIESLSVREVPGHHAYQTSSGARPTLARIPSSGRRNLLTRTEEFDNAAWAKTDATITPNVEDSPVGTATADRLTDNASAQVHNIRHAVSGNPAGKTFTASVYAKAETLTALRIVIQTSTGVPSNVTYGSFNLSTETSTGGVSGDHTFIGTTIEAVPGFPGWYRCSVTGTVGADTTWGGSSPGVGIRSEKPYETHIYSGTGETILFAGAQLVEGSTATNYQKVVATTDVTESGFNDLWHLVFDGSDDSLVTNAVDFSGTDEMTVIAGVRKLSDAANACIAELSATVAGNQGSFAFFTGTPIAAGAELHFTSRGAAAASTSQAGVSAAFASPVSLVATGFSDISNDSSAMRINGAASGTIGTVDQGSGNFGNYQLFIGRRNQTTFPFNGHIYQLIIRGKTTPTGTIADFEKLLARRCGVTF